MTGSILGVDVGGTFTDVVLLDPGGEGVRIAKVSTTPDDQSQGFLAGIAAAEADPAALDAVVHGTTTGTNAIIERKGARCGLITTDGFRDALELGRRTRPSTWGLTGTFEALIPRELRLEVSERIDAAGNVLEPLDEDGVRGAIAQLLAEGCEALVIHFLHSFAYPEHELRAGEIAAELWPNAFVTLGADVLPEIREFERASTAALNAFIHPVMASYLTRLSDGLDSAGHERELLVMQGNGGMMSAGEAARRPAQTVMSGPAAGAIAAARIATRAGYDHVIACDMGGTSCDLTLIRDGTPLVTTEKDMAYSIPLRVPLVDLHTIGSGGGSIARVHEGGLLRVGPESAGADPGPLCYGRGGEEPTVTDANVLLGRIDPTAITAAAGAPDLEWLRTRFAESIGDPLGLTPEEAATAVLTVANDQMAGAARLVSIERGHDPREFALFAFGGAGPLHAAEIARELGVETVIVPPHPGITSALGCVLADVRHDFVQSLQQPLANVTPTEVDAVYASQREAGEERIAAEGIPVAAVETVHEADLLYKGQSHVFRVAVESPGFDVERVRADFAALYSEQFRIELPEMVPVLVSLRTTVVGRRDALGLLPSAQRAVGGAAPGSRRVWFDGEWVDTSIYQRDAFGPGDAVAGPAIIEQADTTTLVEPGMQARVDEFGNLLIPIPPKPAEPGRELDPVTVAVVHRGLGSIATEMDLVHVKTSFSPIISEALDRANGMYEGDTGEIIVQGDSGLPIFLSVMQSTVQAAIEHRSDLEPGDVVIVNDPYFGGTHLMDVKMLRPFYYRGELWCYLANTGHWSDTGGMVPGGFCATATEIQQEGLRLPPIKLVKGGELVQDVVDVIVHNVRVPEERTGDMRAQLGALSVGEERLTALLDKYGADTVEAVIAEMRDHSERQMRAHIDEISDGDYSCLTYMDGDGFGEELLDVAVDVKIDGSEMFVDLSRSSPPCRGPVNSVWATTLGAILSGMKHLYPEVPINAGCFRPIHVAKPHGTFLYAEYPKPVCGCAAETSMRVMESLFGAIGPVIGERAFGAPASTAGNFTLGGFDPDKDNRYVMYIFSGGGYGGWPGGDGISNGCSTIGISKTQPLEILENHYPVIFDEYALREGSSGAGRQRGGFGVRYRVRLLRGDGTASFMMDHGRTRPFGLLGGKEAAMNEVLISMGDEQVRPRYNSKGDGYELAPGDWVEVRTPGGGGFGDPLEREPALVERDVRRGYFPEERAADDYGWSNEKSAEQ